MVDVVTDVIIERPRSVVAGFAAEPSNAPQWYVNIKSVEWKTAPPVLRVGAQIAFVAQFLGRRMAYTYKVTELVPGERMTMATQEGPFPMETIYTWETYAGQSTKMTLRNRGNPTGFSALVAPFMSGAMRRANRKDLARLKALLEQS